MISISQFEKLVERPESSILDFKREIYDFDKDADLKATSSFVKDIVSFANTIRSESAFILFGIEEKKDGNKDLIGVNTVIDDAILQDKIKDKVMPIPKFETFGLNYKDKLYFIIEIPICSYDTPIYPVRRLKGLNVGSIYLRRNSANSDANGLEIIQIQKWLDSLRNSLIYQNVIMSKSTFINQLTNVNNFLAPVITDLLGFAESNDYTDLKQFCKGELQGWDFSKQDRIEERFSYRTQKIIFSPIQIQFNPYSMIKLSSNQLYHELSKRDDFFEYQIRFSQPITILENFQTEFKSKEDGGFLTYETTANDFIQSEKFKGMKIIVYIFPETIDNVLLNIRQKTIDILLKP